MEWVKTSEQLPPEGEEVRAVTVDGLIEARYFPESRLRSLPERFRSYETGRDYRVDQVVAWVKIEAPSWAETEIAERAAKESGVPFDAKAERAALLKVLTDNAKSVD